MSLAPSADPNAVRYPAQPLLHLDALWIQVAGTLCNLRCTHCLVSAGPGEDRHGFMSREEVRRRVAEALPLGVREFYFTGGEPFLHPEMLGILADTLPSGPCTVLTNGTLLGGPRIDALARLSRATSRSLEIRVSLDGLEASAHDAIRGPGSFARALDGIRRLEAEGLLPIVTVTRTEASDPDALAEACAEMLRREGVRRPRIKLLPMLRIGREAERRRGYSDDETLAGLPPSTLEARAPQCSGCRAVTSRGVFVCPLLVDVPQARMGDRLEDALGPYVLRHGACYECFVTGMTCGNAS